MSLSLYSEGLARAREAPAFMYGFNYRFNNLRFNNSHNNQ